MTISKIFQPKFQYILQRIGKKNDGGYLVGPFAVQNSKYLISYGINDDWSFEKNFYKLNHNIKIITYDDKLNFFFLFNRLVINFFKIFIPGYKSFFFRSFFNIFDYFYFIKKTYKKKKIVSGDTVRIAKNYSHIFFKIDIEGSEYKILQDLIKIKKKISGIVIEFHHPDKNLRKIKSFIKKINLKITHIHGNNYWGVNKYGDPKLYEITLEKKPQIKFHKVNLPHPLDMRNNPDKKEIILNFSK